MGLGTILDLAAVLNLKGARLALRSSELARAYFSDSLRLYDEFMERGLPQKDPAAFLVESGWTAGHAADQCAILPTDLNAAGGTRLEELAYLATATMLLRPKKVFEIGTFLGRTTCVFILNSPPDAKILTLDLAPDADVSGKDYIDSDVDLVHTRQVGAYARALGLQGRYEQLLEDSAKFDPQPHQGTVELAFIDGAHSLEYVRNDTEKVAVMMAQRGLVFWHDYGGKGRFRALSEYLESLGRKAAIYRIPRTTLAWSTTGELRRAVGAPVLSPKEQTVV